MTKAYFDCVNDNGGINGRPIDYTVEEEHIDPAEIAGLAKKLIEDDGVLGLVGNTSLIDCSVNGAYYAEKGFFPIIAGVDQACFENRQLLGRQHGPVLLEPGRGAGGASRRGEGNDGHRHAEPARRRHHQQRRRPTSPRRTASRASA